MSDQDPADLKPKKDRSPSFPFIPLGKAVDRARAFAENHRRSPARLISVANTWGYAPKSSGLQQTVAALKQYGLMEDSGSGDERKFQLSELAWRILMDSRPGAREQAVKEAALRPRLFSEYATQWLPERPSDSHCVSELHLDRGFTPDAAGLFLRVFDDTVRYANLSEGDKASGIDDYEPEPEPSQMPAPAHAATRETLGMTMRRAAQSTAARDTGPPRATLPLPEGIVALEIPMGLSKRSLAALKSWLAVMVQLAEMAGEDGAPPPSSPGPP